jgi:hypothetical protein
MEGTVMATQSAITSETIDIRVPGSPDSMLCMKSGPAILGYVSLALYTGVAAEVRARTRVIRCATGVPGMTGGGMLSNLVLVVDLNPNEHLKENV